MAVDHRKSVLLAGFIGNVVEWYDFALYGYLAGVFGELFFPSQNHTASLLAAYGAFGAGFIMRPLGAALFGWFGDIFGRGKTMLISVTMMAVPTFLLGALPTYAAVGIWAPVLLVVVRLIQGLSVGGEFSSSVTYLVETAPDGERGYTGSWANIGSMTGMLLGAGAATIMTTALSQEALSSWGWRVPFLFGSVIGGFAIYVRRRLPPSPHFERHKGERSTGNPLAAAWTHNRRQSAQALLIASGYGVFFYFAVVYLPNWVHDQTGVPLSTAMEVNTAATACMVPLILLSGLVGDRYIRRKHFMLGAFALVAVTSYPLFVWLSNGALAAMITVQLLLDIVVAVPLGSAPALFAELFPTFGRLSGYSLAYNIGLGVVGGITPMTCTWLISTTGTELSPAAFLALAAGLSTVVLFSVTDLSREPLR